MKKINYPLLIGGILFMVFLFAYISPEIFTSKDPMFEEPHRNMEVMVEGELKDVFTMHPIFPNEENLMGTDDAGRDMYTRLVYGTRNTLKLGFFVGLFRLLLAVPIGILAGMGKKFFQRLLLFLSTYFTAVPILLVSYLIFRLNFFRNLQIDQSILWFSGIFALLGFSKAAVIVSDAVKRIMAEDFIEGQIAIGKTWPQIVRQNILPHVMPVAVSTFFKEVGQGLFLLAQLAVLGIFVGTIREAEFMAFRASYEMSLEPEWGSMLMNLTKDMGRIEAQWWLVVYPVAVFSAAVLTMNLLGEGLRMEFMKRNSRFVSYMRKAYSVLSIRVFFLELTHMRKYWKTVLLKAGTLTAVVVIAVVPRYTPVGDFQVENAVDHLTLLSGEAFGGRVSGSEGGFEAGEYIKDQMSALGFTLKEQPLRYAYKLQDHMGNVEYEEEEPVILPGMEKDYVLGQGAPLAMKEATVTLTDEKGNTKTYGIHKDFSILELPTEGKLPGEKVTVTGRSYFAEDGYEGEETSLMPVEYLSLEQSVLFSYGPPMGEESLPARFQMVTGHEARANARSGYSLKIMPFGELAEKLSSGEHQVEVTYSIPDYPMYSGRTLEAWLVPEGKKITDLGEVLIIGVPYDGVYLEDGTSSVEGTVPVALALELARAMTEGGRTYEKPLMFLFYDNETDLLLPAYFKGSGSYSMRRSEISANGGYSYLELMGTGLKDNKVVDLVAYFGQLDKENSFRSILQMEKILKDQKVPYLRTQNLLPKEGVLKSRGILDTASPSILEFRANAHVAVGVGNAYKNEMGTAKDTLKNLNRKKLERVGIMLTDLLISKEYFRLGEK